MKKHWILRLVLLVVIVLGTSRPAKADSQKADTPLKAPASDLALQACYEKVLVIEETSVSSGEKVSEVLSDDQKLQRCNESVVNAAGTKTKVKEVLDLAKIVGRKSNWASAAPVYVKAAELDQKAACEDPDLILSLKEGLAQEASAATLEGTLRLAKACYPNDEALLKKQVILANDPYTAKNLCPFLKDHHVKLSKLSEALCGRVK